MPVRCLRLSEVHPSHGQELLHAAPGVHSFCGADVEGLRISAPYVIVESLCQFSATILQCIDVSK